MNNITEEQVIQGFADLRLGLDNATRENQLLREELMLVRQLSSARQVEDHQEKATNKLITSGKFPTFHGERSISAVRAYLFDLTTLFGAWLSLVRTYV